MPRSNLVAAALRAAVAFVVVLAAASARAAPGVTYVALGDSTATGVGAESGGGYPARLARRLEASGVPVRFLNLGVPGATLADLRRDQLPHAMAAGPTLLTIGIGINDVVQGRSLAEFSRDLQIMADQLHRTKAVVVISTLPDLSLSPSAKGAPPSLSRRIQQYNAAIQTVADRYGFVVADLWSASRAAAKKDGAAIWASDGFHPSAAGYEHWTDALWQPIERALAPRVQARRPTATVAQ